MPLKLRRHNLARTRATRTGGLSRSLSLVHREVMRLTGLGMRKVVRPLADVASGTWFLSWFAPYLEIYRYHHVVLSRIGDVLCPPANAAARPGGFLRTVVVCSVAAPLHLAAANSADRSDWRSAS